MNKPQSARDFLNDLYEEIPDELLVPTPVKSNYPTSVEKEPPKRVTDRTPEGVEVVRIMLLPDTVPPPEADEREKAEARRVEIEQQKHFLVAYMNTYDPSRAAVHAGIPLQRVSRWRKAPAFDKLYQQVTDVIVESLEAEGLRRAFTGSDRLLIKFLEGLLPEKYGRTTRVTGSGPGGSLNVNVTSWQELAKTVAMTASEKASAVEVEDADSADGDGGTVVEVPLRVIDDTEEDDEIPPR